MNYYIFKKEDNDFSELLNDKELKPLFIFKLKYDQHIILGSYDKVESILESYITLKYGELLVSKSDVFINRKPKVFVDYTPDTKRPNKFKNL